MVWSNALLDDSTKQSEESIGFGYGAAPKIIKLRSNVLGSPFMLDGDETFGVAWDSMTVVQSPSTLRTTNSRSPEASVLFDMKSFWGFQNQTKRRTFAPIWLIDSSVMLWNRLYGFCSDSLDVSSGFRFWSTVVPKSILGQLTVCQQRVIQTQEVLRKFWGIQGGECMYL